jgi:hypothetical protein
MDVPTDSNDAPFELEDSQTTLNRQMDAIDKLVHMLPKNVSMYAGSMLRTAKNENTFTSLFPLQHSWLKGNRANTVIMMKVNKIRKVNTVEHALAIKLFEDVNIDPKDLIVAEIKSPADPSDFNSVVLPAMRDVTKNGLDDLLFNSGIFIGYLPPFPDEKIEKEYQRVKPLAYSIRTAQPLSVFDDPNGYGISLETAFPHGWLMQYGVVVDITGLKPASKSDTDVDSTMD